MNRFQSMVSAEKDLNEALQQFCGGYPHCTVTPVSSGNINDTYLVKAANEKFILQRISATVFPDPLRVIANFRAISSHLDRKRKTMVSGPDWQFAKPVLTCRGQLYWKDDDGNYWRAQTYLPHKPVTMLSDHRQARELGKALGLFHLLIADIDSAVLSNPLPGFHILPTYLEQFDLVRQKKCRTGYEDSFCRKIIEKYREKAALLEVAREKGILILRPIHGDPKIDNFVFDEDGYGVGLIDMDTAGSGLLHYDIGDCLRSSCNRDGEEGEQGHDIKFDMNICAAILDGYFLRAGSLLSPVERRYVFAAVLLLTFELGLRFFTDHLVGNKYFKVNAEGVNLQKAVVQFRLVEEIEKNEDSIRAIAEESKSQV